ncbi:MAG: hypothetical protein FJ014_13210 [Chloroflexi bacterium]|nr:hypothetical protein [Chloroflexota bacterium]
MAEVVGLTAEMYRAVVTIVDERVKEIRVTREDFNALKGAVQELAQAQARAMLPGYLECRFGLVLEGMLGEKLNCQFFQIDGQEVRINLYGDGKRNGQWVVVLGEAKSRIFRSDVEEFAERLALVEPALKGEVVRVMFGYFIHPSAEVAARERDILVVASYQR